MRIKNNDILSKNIIIGRDLWPLCNFCITSLYIIYIINIRGTSSEISIPESKMNNRWYTKISVQAYLLNYEQFNFVLDETRWKQNKVCLTLSLNSIFI